MTARWVAAATPKLLWHKVQPGGRIIGVDRDPLAVERTAERLQHTSVEAVWGSYADIPEVLRDHDISAADGIVLDLGLSSDQLADEERGFSYLATGPLDLRFNPRFGEPAFRLVNRLSEKELANLIYEFGEERLSRRIARKVVEVRRKSPIHTAAELSELLCRCVPRSKDGLHPATRTFQALRIAVNEELKQLRIALKRLPDCLKPGGRLAIISFHSLEDRMVKNAFKEDSRLDVLTKKPLRPSEAEVHANPRARSAKFRIAERI
ncbi:MAG: 16S rRNA (cytosine(1402)-N(4))-methyltransferase RsmH [Pirellulaceae bacterium]